MFNRLLAAGVRRYVGGPGRSWVFTSAALLLWRQVSKAATKKEIIDLSSTKPGDKIVIEHLNVTHQEQLKAQKRSQKADKVSAKAAKKERKANKPAKQRTGRRSQPAEVWVIDS